MFHATVLFSLSMHVPLSVSLCSNTPPPSFALPGPLGDHGERHTPQGAGLRGLPSGEDGRAQCEGVIKILTKIIVTMIINFFHNVAALVNASSLCPRVPQHSSSSSSSTTATSCRPTQKTRGEDASTLFSRTSF